VPILAEAVPKMLDHKKIENVLLGLCDCRLYYEHFRKDIISNLISQTKKSRLDKQAFIDEQVL